MEIAQLKNLRGIAWKLPVLAKASLASVGNGERKEAEGQVLLVEKVRVTESAVIPVSFAGFFLPTPLGREEFQGVIFQSYLFSGYCCLC